MSRVANAPVVLPSGVEVKLSGQDLAVKGSKGEMSMSIHSEVAVNEQDGALRSVRMCPRCALWRPRSRNIGLELTREKLHSNGNDANFHTNTTNNKFSNIFI